jgi:putative ABC transport system ATP-binding protein
LLQIQDLGRKIQGRWIWQQLNLVVQPGERWAIAGPAGAGKSLLLRAIAALDPVQAGQILFQGQPLSESSIPHYRTRVLYLHQRPALLEGTVEQNLQFLDRLQTHHHLPTYKTQKPQIVGYLEHLGRTADFLQRPVAALSGGEAQIAAFLRALCCTPTLLLLDEPTASLDAAATEQFEQLLHRWQQQDSQRAYLLVSHDPQQRQRLTEQQLVLGDGVE